MKTYRILCCKNKCHFADDYTLSAAITLVSFLVLLLPTSVLVLVLVLPIVVLVLVLRLVVLLTSLAITPDYLVSKQMWGQKFLSLLRLQTFCPFYFENWHIYVFVSKAVDSTTTVVGTWYSALYRVFGIIYKKNLQ